MSPVLSLVDRVRNLQARQGGTPIEAAMLTGTPLFYAPHGTTNPGVNQTYAAGIDGVPTVCFHKRFAGVDAAIANAYGQSPDTAPINECAAWMLAKALGSPYDQLVPPCVLRELGGEHGSLSLGIPGDAPSVVPLGAGHPQGRAAAFYDSLIAQQDRHAANFRWDGQTSRLYLIDHGYAFARSGDYCNASIFVVRRWQVGASALSLSEQDAPSRLLAAPDLFGLAEVLEHPRADLLADRAKRMLASGAILPLGDF